MESAALPSRVTAVEENLLRVARSLDTLALSQEQTDTQLRALAHSQDQTDTQLKALAYSQDQTDAQLRVLAQSQDQTDAQLKTLARSQEKLAESQEQTQASIRAMGDGFNRRVGYLENMAGSLFEPHLERKIGGLLAPAGLRVEALGCDRLALYLQSRGAHEQDMGELIDQPDWLGIARGDGGSALVIGEASLTADEHDLERLDGWRRVAARYGIPAIPVLVARKRSSLFPTSDELRQRGFAWLISNERERGVPGITLGAFSL